MAGFLLFIIPKVGLDLVETPFDLQETQTAARGGERPIMRSERVVPDLNPLRSEDDLEVLMDVLDLQVPDIVILRGLRTFNREAQIIGIINRTLVTEGADLGKGDILRTATLLYELLFARFNHKYSCFPGLDIFKYFPKIEYPAFISLLLEQIRNGEPTGIFAPVCPDFDDSYTFMYSGLGNAMKRLLLYSLPIFYLLDSFGFEYKIIIHLADADGLDEYFLARLGIDSQTFALNIKGTLEAIQAEVDRGMGAITNKTTEVTLMLAFLQEMGLVDYLHELKTQTYAISQSEAKVVRGTLASLYKIRRGEGLPEHPAPDRLSIACELASYYLYGSVLGGSGLILTPDTLSGTAAYNFPPNIVTPTIGVHDIKVR